MKQTQNRKKRLKELIKRHDVTTITKALNFFLKNQRSKNDKKALKICLDGLSSFNIPFLKKDKKINFQVLHDAQWSKSFLEAEKKTGIQEFHKKTISELSENGCFRV